MIEHSQFEETRKYWDGQASSFDQEPDHGLSNATIRKAWKGLFKEWLPKSQNRILDIGCGTGSVSSLLAEIGHQVTGIDLSSEMINLAKTKSEKASNQIEYYVMEASNPAFLEKSFDGIVCRHLLWTLPNPVQVLANWSKLLKSRGRILIIEGYWHPGGGMHAAEIVAMLPANFVSVMVQDLSTQTDYWGREVDDERFAITAELP